MRVLAIAAAVLILFGCGKTETKAEAQPKPVPAAETVAQTPPPPPQPTHYYALEENGEYGYEKGISEDDQKAGKMTSALLMVRYLGEKDGTYTVAMVQGPARNTVTCKAPCTFVKSKIAVNGQVLQSETTRATEGSLIWAIMADAMSGQLKPYKPGKS